MMFEFYNIYNLNKKSSIAVSPEPTALLCCLSNPSYKHRQLFLSLPSPFSPLPLFLIPPPFLLFLLSSFFPYLLLVVSVAPSF